MVCPSVIAEQAFKHFLQQWFYGLSPSLTLKTEETGAISIVSEVRSDSQPRQLQKTKRRSSQASRLKRRARRAQERLVGSADNTNSCKPSGSGQCGSSFTPRHTPTMTVSKSLESSTASSDNQLADLQRIGIEEENIPQVDGYLDDVLTSPDSPRLVLKCSNCEKTYNSKHKLEAHEHGYPFKCNRCFLCHQTQFHADLHELEAHPHSAHAREVPYGVKLQFNIGCRIPYSLYD